MEEENTNNNMQDMLNAIMQRLDAIEASNTPATPATPAQVEPEVDNVNTPVTRAEMQRQEADRIKQSQAQNADVVSAAEFTAGIGNFINENDSFLPDQVKGKEFLDYYKDTPLMDKADLMKIDILEHALGEQDNYGNLVSSDISLADSFLAADEQARRGQVNEVWQALLRAFDVRNKLALHDVSSGVNGGGGGRVGTTAMDKIFKPRELQKGIN